ncbi:MAG: TIGR00295 family protein [Methanosphaera sp.]|uniref:TIGR00295 family protein n=1 Tax=Methanosphaera sp. TaxID=2666342 RepID=UPI002E7A2046|nr:TIGR00295 family protein [Methanosphaera sp.]MEE1117418.1 TIGR00295 family protein [Methanosphaera sp.]MEE3418671.1 TIGR00295 family protein [Methanosphaera sp.]
MSNIDTLIDEVYLKLKCSDYIIDHCKVVYERSKDITIFYDNVDLDLIKAGCMLHDVGRTITNGIEHAYLGADLLRDLEVDEKICLITERHIGAGITPDEAKALGLPDRNYIPETIEEKIVAHSDNLVHGVTKVDLDFVIEKWNNKNMKQESIDMLIKLHEELLGD